MNLDDHQKKEVARWIEQGAKLAEIQKRLESEFGLRVTYLDLRLLVDDLKLTPRDQPPAAPPKTIGQAAGAAAAKPGEKVAGQPSPAPGKVSLKVDVVARAGALASGSATFSDGASADWVLDQFGRLGFMPKKQGYKPSARDLERFQTLLQDELQRQGF